MKQINETTFTSDNGLITFIHGDCTLLMKGIVSNSVDIILTDPPYKYLKNQKLEVDFDETIFFNEVKRVLKNDGFIVLFGRGVSFYRWNCILDNLGFTFKEEIIWQKQPTSPAMAIGRIHETISIFSKGKGVINRVRVPFFEKYKHEPEKILEVVKRISTTFGNRDTFRQLKQFYENGKLEYYSSHNGHGVSLSAENRKTVNRTVQFARGLEEGITEQTIIKETRDHYNTFHPTQKPVKLLERLLALVIPKDKESKDIIVLDPFAGSFSTAKACKNLNMKFTGIELDKEYFDKAINRFKIYEQQQTLF